MKNEIDDDFFIEASKIIQEEIDREIIDHIIATEMKSKGWTAVYIKPSVPGLLASEWIHLNATGDYRFAQQHWYFENSIDATNFALKWA
jgi:hypothetical protein